jgi:hypothetical protein
MKRHFIHEPELEFGTGSHVDIRFGLMDHGPPDRFSSLAPKDIKLGVVGTPETVEGVNKWLEKCKQGVAAKTSNHPNLFPRFPGYGADTNLSADLLLDSQLTKTILPKEFDKLCRGIGTSQQKIEEAVNWFLDSLMYLKEKELANVFVVAVPMSLMTYMLEAAQPQPAASRESGKEDNEGEEEDDEIKETKIDFHHLLKAKAMRDIGKPIQLILPWTYDESKRLPQKLRKDKVKELQDEATRAWNFYVALYYKAGGRPWRLVRDPADYTVCYIGVSFYKTLDGSKLLTSTAQVFNERGDGIILRGGSAQKSKKDDRQIHMNEEDAYNLIYRALKVYKTEHYTLPARVVIHKTSAYNQDELSGFSRAIEQYDIGLTDYIHVRDAFSRLYRGGAYPPLRGTLFSKDDKTHVLYTRGGVDFYSTYTGMYVPLPLEMNLEEVTQTPYFLAQEILALTKMNWNSTQFDGDDPITVKAARRVGDILKYVDHSDIQQRYSYYM